MTRFIFRNTASAAFPQMNTNSYIPNVTVRQPAPIFNNPSVCHIPPSNTSVPVVTPLSTTLSRRQITPPNNNTFLSKHGLSSVRPLPVTNSTMPMQGTFTVSPGVHRYIMTNGSGVRLANANSPVANVYMLPTTKLPSPEIRSEAPDPMQYLSIH